MGIVNLEHADFENLANLLGVHDFDLMLVADGSGNTAEEDCGFACFAYERESGRIRCHWGQLSHGTNNLAELFPFVHALWYMEAADRRQEIGLYRVLCVSDSELTVRQGMGVYARRANSSLWKAMEEFERIGFVLTWKHVRRNSNPINAECDRLAGKVRKRTPCAKKVDDGQEDS